MNDKKTIMVGPALEGLGGISRVVKTWQSSSFFSDYNVKYIPSCTDTLVNRSFFLIKRIFEFTLSLIRGRHLVYIHTSSHNSFRRKCLFILIAILFGKKIILHIHPTHFAQFLSEVAPLEKKFIFFFLKRIDTFIVLTEEMKEYIQGLFPQKLVIVLRNPINLEKMKNTNGHQRMHNHLLYLGWYVKEKGVYELVDAIEILVRKGIKIHLDCYGTKQVEKLKNFVREKQLTEQISINGWIDDVKKLGMLYKCTMLILASHSEGIPNVILEAMATNTPIIATAVGGLKEVLRDGDNAIIIQPKNHQDLSEKILIALRNPCLRKKISTNAYQDAVNQYNVCIIRRRFRQIIEAASD